MSALPVVYEDGSILRADRVPAGTRVRVRNPPGYGLGWDRVPEPTPISGFPGAHRESLWVFMDPASWDASFWNDYVFNQQAIAPHLVKRASGLYGVSLLFSFEHPERGTLVLHAQHRHRAHFERVFVPWWLRVRLEQEPRISDLIGSFVGMKRSV